MNKVGQMRSRSPWGRTFKIVASIFGGLVAIVGLLSQLPGAGAAWCQYFSRGCIYDRQPIIISLAVPPGNPCPNPDGIQDHCILPTPGRVFVKNTFRFESTVPPNLAFEQSRLNDGDPSRGPILGRPFSGSGWFLTKEKEDVICYRVYAVTGACEEKYGIFGQFKVKEKVPWF